MLDVGVDVDGVATVVLVVVGDEAVAVDVCATVDDVLAAVGGTVLELC